MRSGPGTRWCALCLGTRSRAWFPASTPAPAASFTGRAIYNVYFDFGAQAVLADEGPLTALVDGHPFQFVYRKPSAAAGRFVLIASACSELDGRSVADIERIARDQIACYYPTTPLPAAGVVRVTKEPSATLLAGPDEGSARPPVGRHRELENLLVCGDWTQTRLPSTLEGAAAAGFGVVSSAAER